MERPELSRTINLDSKSMKSLNDAICLGLEKAATIHEAETRGRLVILPPHENNPYDGLKVKYRVYKARNGEPVENCFVLRPDKDMAARMAIRRYAECTENRQLAADLEMWVDEMLEVCAFREAAEDDVKEQHYE